MTADLDVAALRTLVRDIPDFPRPGVGFKDITPLLGDPRALASAVGALAEGFQSERIDKVVGVEARGFMLGAPVALALDAGFVPVRKLGKLPAATVAREYELEYGTDHLEVHTDAISSGERVLVVDDVLATGGTAATTAELVEAVDGTVVGLAFLIELVFLGGAARLDGRRHLSLLTYE